MFESFKIFPIPVLMKIKYNKSICISIDYIIVYYINIGISKLYSLQNYLYSKLYSFVAVCSSVFINEIIQFFRETIYSQKNNVNCQVKHIKFNSLNKVNFCSCVESNNYVIKKNNIQWF